MGSCECDRAELYSKKYAPNTAPLKAISGWSGKCGGTAIVHMINHKVTAVLKTKLVYDDKI